MSKGPASKGGIPSKVENFNDWYPFIVEASDLVDKLLPNQRYGRMDLTAGKLCG